jgi:hypothetical protein
MAASCLTMLVCCLSTARWRAVCRFTFCRSILARPTWINSSATYGRNQMKKARCFERPDIKETVTFFSISKIFMFFFSGKSTRLILYVLNW